MIKVKLLALTFLILFLAGCVKSPDYSCRSDSDCASTCRWGCMNMESAKDFSKDDYQCLRAWDCSCVENTCYSDGHPWNR